MLYSTRYRIVLIEFHIEPSVDPLTCPHDVICLISNRVQNVKTMKEFPHSCGDLHHLSVQYSNRRHLSCHLGNLRSVPRQRLPLTNHLTSINIVLFDPTWLVQIRKFLNSSPHLYLFTIFFMLTIYTKKCLH